MTTVVGPVSEAGNRGARVWDGRLCGQRQGQVSQEGRLLDVFVHVFHYISFMWHR